jgi:tetratricopeptide (TPR) repeat protein
MVVGVTLAWSGASVAVGQQELRLGETGRWSAGAEGPVNQAISAEPAITEARRLIAGGEASKAREILQAWIVENERGESPWLADAYLLRGDAMLAMDEEYNALTDYETLVKEFPGSPAFTTALERQFEIGKRYLAGLRKRILGVRLENAEPIGEELMLRIAERLPDSQLAELAVLELGDYYYRTRNLRGAADTYDVFLEKFPLSEHRGLAHRRKILANVAQFKGPDYDASGLREARLGVEDFADRFPAEAARTGMGDALVARLDESAAAQMYSSARWYLKRGDAAAGRLMLSRVTEAYAGTVAAQQALDVMLERGWVKPAAARVPGEDGGEQRP